jgi:long-chain acyl-CoA synthetase
MKDESAMYIGDQLSHYAKTQPDKPAICFDYTQITYKEFLDHITGISNGLIQMLGEGGRRTVALWLGNRPEFLESFFAIIRLGWIAVPLDKKWTTAELRHAMSIARPDAVIVEKDFPEPQETLVIPVEQLYHDSHGRSNLPEPPTENELFYLGFTSGTTGKPKGYVRNHGSWLKSFSAGETAFGFHSGHSVLAPGPLCHSLSLFAAIHAIHSGSTFYMLESFDVDKAYRLLEEGCVDMLHVVPTMLEKLMAQYRREQTINQSVKWILASGAYWEEHSKKRAKQLFPQARLFEYYGASELSFVAYQEYPSNDNGSKPFPGVRIRICDQSGRDVEPGEIGQVYIDSPLIFSGYVRDENETKKVLTSFGATVGDMGRMDLEGRLHIVGRRKNMFKSGGLKVYPEEVEHVIKSHPSVEEAVVIGIKDEYWGEKGIACVKWRQKESEEEIKRFCKQHLAAYKCPKQWVEMDNWPLTKSGKIDRFTLKQWLEKVLACQEQ